MIVINACLNAQQIPEFYHHHLIPSNGFTDVQYNEYIYKDNKGLVWISGAKGWHCYNGLEFKHYPFTNNPKEGIFGNYIQSNMYEDEIGNLWFSTYNAINCFNRQQNQFTYFQVVNSLGDTIQKDYKVFHLEKESNLLFLRAGELVYQFDICTSLFHSLAVPTSGQRFKIGNNRLDSLLIIASPWYEGKGIEIIEKDSSWKAKRYLEKITLLNTTIKPTIRQAIIEKDSLAWLIAKEGLLLFHLRKKKLESANPFLPPGFSHINFMQGVILDDNRILLASVDFGLWIFDTEHRLFTKNYSKDKKNSASLLSNSPININKDRDDQVWISYKDVGVEYLSRQQTFKKVSLSGDLEELIPVSFLEIDQNRQKWIGTKHHGIYVLDQDNQLLRHFPFDKKKKRGLPIDELRYFSSDAKGNIWCMSHKKVFRFESKLQKWIQVVDYSNGQLFFMLHLKNGATWFSSSNAILELQYNQEGAILTPIEKLQNHQNCDFLHLFETSKGNILIDCDARSLFIFNSSLQELKRVKTNAGINNFFEASNGSVWISTTKGLGVLDTALSFHFMEQKLWRLNGVEIFRLEEDSKNNFWISSSSGLFKYTPKDSLLVEFQEADGLPKVSFLPYSSFSSSGESIYFGNTDGFLSFNPQNINISSTEPKVQICNLLINHQPYKEQPINELKSLNLRYFENDLTFQLVSLDYHQPHNNYLRYRIQENTPDWKTIKSGDFIYMNNLSAGQHTLEVIGYNANGIKSKSRLVTIIISLPFWKTIWFQILIFLLPLLLLGIIQYYYTQRQLEVQRSIFEKEQTIQEERNRIASELHDDMGAGLSIIKFISDDLISEQLNIDMQKKLEKISDSSQILFEKMKDIIWALNRENDELAQLIFYLNKYAIEYLDISQLQRTIIIPETIPKKVINGIFRRHILLLVQELLHNIVKHAKAQHVKIQFKISDQNLFIQISDDGIGYDPEENSIGQGMKNIRKRVHLLHGKIKISSTPGRGTRMLAVIPF